MERRMLGVFAIISFITEMRMGVFRVFFILYLYEKMGTHYTQTEKIFTIIGIIFTLITAVNALSQIFWGWVSDRIAKRKHFIVLGEGIPGVVFLLFPRITNIIVLAVILIMIQVFWSMATPAWKALIAELSKPGERGELMGKITTFGGIGSIVGLYIMGDLIPQYGYNYFFYFSSLCMFAASLVAVLIREPEGLVPSRQKLLSVEQVKTLYMGHRSFSLFTVLILLSLFAAELISRFMPLYVRVLGGDVREISYLFILEDGIETALMTPMGRLTDKVGRVRMLQISLLMRAFAVLFFYLSPVWWYLFPAMVIESIGWSGYHVSWFAVLSSLTPRERRGTYMGFHNSVVLSLSSIAPSVGGPIADGFGLKVLFLSSFVLSFLIAVCFINWLQRNQKEIDESEN